MNYFKEGKDIEFFPSFISVNPEPMILNRLLLSFVILCIVFDLSGQRLEIIKTGRPETFEYNNAERIVARKWGIEFGYVAFDGVNFDLLDSITARNEVAEKKLAAQKGADWNAVFRKQVDAELKKDDALREQIKTKMGAEVQDKMIGLEQAKCNRNQYKAFVFALPAGENQGKFLIYREYRIHAKSGKIKLKSTKIREIHFEYIENGITQVK